MTQPPTVSVVLPVYNAERYLIPAIASILTQTYSDFELIVMNDGSTDRSAQILKDFQNQDQRIRIFNQKNSGIVVALNNGLRQAQGRYIARMDGDDVAMPERFAKQVAFLEANPDHVAVGSQTLMIDPEGLPIKHHNQLTTHEQLDTAYLAGEFGAITHPAVMLRRDAVLQIGGYRTEMNLAEDDDLFLRLAEIGKLANLPDVLLYYRQHLTSFSATKLDQGWQRAQTALQEAYRRRGLQPQEMPKAIADDVDRMAIAPAFSNRVTDVTNLPRMESSSAIEPRSISKTHALWSWWALEDGNLATARKHAWLATRKQPISGESWKALVCAVRGW
jgi:GT2 family glycosyltransferase